MHIHGQASPLFADFHEYQVGEYPPELGIIASQDDLHLVFTIYPVPLGFEALTDRNNRRELFESDDWLDTLVQVMLC